MVYTSNWVDGAGSTLDSVIRKGLCLTFELSLEEQAIPRSWQDNFHQIKALKQGQVWHFKGQRETRGGECDL